MDEQEVGQTGRLRKRMSGAGLLRKTKEQRYGVRGAVRRRTSRAGAHAVRPSFGFGLLPVLKRLWPRRDAFEIRIDAVCPRRVVGFLSRHFLTASLFFGATFLALAFALALLLGWP